MRSQVSAAPARRAGDVDQRPGSGSAVAEAGRLIESRIGNAFRVRVVEAHKQSWRHAPLQGCLQRVVIQVGVVYLARDAAAPVRVIEAVRSVCPAPCGVWTAKGGIRDGISRCPVNADGISE